MLRSVLTLSVVLLLTATWAHADAVTVDGSDVDWSNPTWYATDPADLASGYEGYDITWFAHICDTDQNRIAFAYTTVGTLPTPGAGVYTRMYLDQDMNSATGGTLNGWSGIDYYIQWDFDNNDAAELYQWNNGTSNYDLFAPHYVGAMKGDGSPGHPDNFVEMSMSVYDTIGNENGPNFWRIVNVVEGPNVVDVVPDISMPAAEEFSPEPGTYALMALGLVGFVVLRRRKSAKP